MEFKGTKGSLRFSPQEGTIGHCHSAQVWDSDGNNLAIIEATTSEEEATSYARLFASAPELLEALQMLVERFETLADHPDAYQEFVKAQSAIKKAL